MSLLNPSEMDRKRKNLIESKPSRMETGLMGRENRVRLQSLKLQVKIYQLPFPLKKNKMQKNLPKQSVKPTKRHFSVYDSLLFSFVFAFLFFASLLT